MARSAARLEVLAGKAAGMSIIIHDELVIGRHAEGAGQLADDEEISRLHARVTLAPDGSCSIEDLGSTNGTFVNGLRISTARTLAEGDTIELGQTMLTVRELPVPAPAPLPASERLAASEAPTAEQPAAGHPSQAPPPPLSVQLEVDFAKHEARISLDPASEPVRLTFEAGSWRVVGPRTDDPGPDPHEPPPVDRHELAS